MIEAAIAGWAAKHWKGLTATVVALVLLIPILLIGGGTGATAAAATAEDDVDLTCVAGAGSVVEVTAAELDEVQRQVTSAIIRAGRDNGVPDQGIVIALAVAYQEGEAWHNPDHGDAVGPDSAGSFQQRDPWGPRADRMDPYKAATMFYTGGKGGQQGLLDIAGWQLMQPSRAGNAVQRSALPDAYAAHLARAQAVLAGAKAAAPTAPAAAPAAAATAVPSTPVAANPCTPVAPSQKGADGRWPAEQLLPEGIKPRTRHVRELVKTTFGETNIGGWCPGGCKTGHVSNSDHYTGNAIDVMILPWSDPARIAAGNAIAAWCSANWDALAIKYVIWRKRITHDGVTWTNYENENGGGITLDHWDHVHISVY